ncbi:hypothetical protein CDD82_1740 [Ophiocordyceps australis]|uniref:ABC transporter domain-containing protein n=1 Tax=Ophiocordyceps australis TaxID=1399860 RepID=A0A2C5ZMB4_9HYPO|nr:hypothetical protein CDD82_1740 [Ophiocordyceps australis]
MAYTLLLLRHVSTLASRVSPTLLDFEADVSKPAGLVSRLTLSWIRNGVETRLDSPEIQDILKPATSQHLAAYNTDSHPSSLLAALLRYVSRDLLRQGAWAALASLLLFVPALILHAILVGIESPETMRTNRAWLLITSLFFSGLVSAIANTQCQWTGSKIYARLNGLLTGDIYAKMLHLPLLVDATKKILTNEFILSIINVDTTIVSEMGAHLHQLCAMPMQLVFAACALYTISGISGVFGLAIYVVFLPLLTFLSAGHAAAKQKTLGATRARTESTADFLSAIRAIKYLAWEKCIKSQVLGLREEELSRKKNWILWGSAFTTACSAMPLIATASALFFQSVVLHTPMRNSTAFPVLVVFVALRLPMERAAQVMSLLSQARISANRIDETLREQKGEIEQPVPCIDSGKLGFENATLRWSTNKGLSQRQHSSMIESMLSGFRLSDLNIEFLIGKINVVFGHPGCGKSSLLLALFGEMELVAQPSDSRSSAAYCSQQPWIQDETIRDNITFGLPFVYQRYKYVLEAVKLIEELPTLYRGDLTVVGENGWRLSLSQRQRVSLARALYSEAQYIIVDDCFSVFDEATTRYILTRAFKGPLMNGRTCILATQHVRRVVPYADHAICLDRGRVRAQGTVLKLVTLRVLSSDFLTAARTSTIILPAQDLTVNGTGFVFKNFSKAPNRYEREPRFACHYEPYEGTKDASWPSVEMIVNYVGARYDLRLTLCVITIQQLLFAAMGLWIEKWSSSGPSPSSQMVGFAIYSALTISSVVLSLARDMMSSRIGTQISRTIHDRLFSAILHAKFRFLDCCSEPQTAQTFGSDLNVVDQEAAPLCIMSLKLAARLVITIVLLTILLPCSSLVLAIFCAACATVATRYTYSWGALRTVEKKRQPVCDKHLEETLTGNVTIRAFQRDKEFMIQSQEKTAQRLQPSMAICASRQWLSLRVSFLASILSCSMAALGIQYANASNTKSGIIGLVLACCMALPDAITNLIELGAILSQHTFGAVERIRQHINAEQEHLERIKDEDPFSRWPQRGGVRFRDFSFYYEGKGQVPAIKMLDINIKAGSRVAMLGPSGCGKSTMGLAMIRGIEPSSGKIILDGVDIGSLSLHALRRLVTFVPSDAATSLFPSESLRLNLDPQLQCSEDEIHQVLQTLQLSGLFSADLNDMMPATLSQGQKQLVCIARALLQKPLVLFLDQATSLMDSDMENMVQETLRDRLAPTTTVITVTDRLTSIADYDYVYIMEAGAIEISGHVG